MRHGSFRRTESEAEPALRGVRSRRYGLPRSRSGAVTERRAGGAIIGNQALIDRVFDRAAIRGGRRLLEDLGLRFDGPHHMPQTFTSGDRRTVTLCADRRGCRCTRLGRWATRNPAPGSCRRASTFGRRGRASDVLALEIASAIWRCVELAIQVPDVFPIRSALLACFGIRVRHALPHLRSFTRRPCGLGWRCSTTRGGYDGRRHRSSPSSSTGRSMTSTSRGRTTSSPTASSPTTRSTGSEAPTSRTSSSSRTRSPTRMWSSSSRTTARRRRSSTPPTR